MAHQLGRECRLPESPCLAPSSRRLLRDLRWRHAGFVPPRELRSSSKMFCTGGPAQVGFGDGLSSFHRVTVSSRGKLSPEPLRLTHPYRVRRRGAALRSPGSHPGLGSGGPSGRKRDRIPGQGACDSRCATPGVPTNTNQSFRCRTTHAPSIAVNTAAASRFFSGGGVGILRREAQRSRSFGHSTSSRGRVGETREVMA